MSTLRAPQARTERRLIGLNLALLLVLGVVTILATSTPQVLAQPKEGSGTASRGRGEYTLVSGRIGSSDSVISITDAQNQEVLALTWDKNRNELDVLGHRKLSEDAMFKQGR